MFRFLKTWTLPLAILTGALAYAVYHLCPCFDLTRPYAAPIVSVVQPVLIFSMLFLSFCKVSPSQLRLRRVHFVHLLFQCGLFAAGSLLLHFFPQVPGSIIIESAMLCLICPTATAAAVVTQKLGGDAADVTMYTLLINLSVAVTIPLLVPLIHPEVGSHFLHSFFLILCRVFPMLICPLLAAFAVRRFAPRLHAWFTSFRDLAFYLWAIALSLAIAVTVRSIVHTDHAATELVGIAFISLFCCILQFGVGKRLGWRYGLPVSTTQSLGQKNTVFAIWLGYTFFNPVTSMAGGFYSIWHNLYNTWQMRAYSRKAGKGGA